MLLSFQYNNVGVIIWGRELYSVFIWHDGAGVSDTTPDQSNDNQCHNRWHLSTQFCMKLESDIRIRQDLRRLISTFDKLRSRQDDIDKIVRVLLNLKCFQPCDNVTLSWWLVTGVSLGLFQIQDKDGSVWCPSPVSASCHQFSLKVIKDSCVLSADDFDLWASVQNDFTISKPI